MLSCSVGNSREGGSRWRQRSGVGVRTLRGPGLGRVFALRDNGSRLSLC